MEKSRYGPLVKLKKKSLDQAEHLLITANHELSDAQERLKSAYEHLSLLSLPTHGSMHELSKANHMFQTQHRIIEQCNEALVEAQGKQLQMQRAFRETMIEYEKFKYLEVQELNERVKKIKEADAKMLDEIGTMTYKREAL